MGAFCPSYVTFHYKVYQSRQSHILWSHCQATILWMVRGANHLCYCDCEGVAGIKANNDLCVRTQWSDPLLSFLGILCGFESIFNASNLVTFSAFSQSPRVIDDCIDRIGKTRGRSRVGISLLLIPLIAHSCMTAAKWDCMGCAAVSACTGPEYCVYE